MDEESQARERVRQIMSAQPSSRPPEFVNPLEKIEQLLTCPICLDRYKQPKLLPCQHSFCYPCLESCADVLHRTLKCPECRAEHNVPYEGVKAFQPNYSLMGFLEIHLQATPDSAAELEEYIHRYNLERCKVCDEKADCEQCAHCDRRACKECRQTHMDMLKRDMSRLLNQVRRLSNRITEASDGLSKGLELLTLNCETTKDEVKEYFHRYQRDLKKREDSFLSEIEAFHCTESRLMSNLRDVLEIESSNMSEAVARLDAAIKGECAMDDSELVRLKNTFTEGIEYLRNFQPDADELFNRKLRFGAGEDAAKLPQAISTSGDLCVLIPQFAGRYLPLEQSYLPKPFRLPLESDHYMKRDIDRASDRDRPSSRISHQRDLDEGSLRYRRRQQLEDEARNRLRGNVEAERSIPGRSPFSRPSEPPVPAVDIRENTLPSTRELPKPTRSEIRERRNTMTILPTDLPRFDRSPVPPKAENPPPIVPIPIPKPPKPSTTAAAVSPIPPSPVIKPPEKDDERVEERIITRKPPLPRQASSNDDSLNEKIDNIRRAHAERQAASSRAASPSDESESEEARPRPRIRIVCRAASITRDDGTDGGAPATPPLPPPAHRIDDREEETTPIPVTHFTGEEDVTVPAWLARRRQRFQRSRTNPDIASQFTSTRVQQLLQERTSRLDNSTSNEEEKRMRRRSASRDAAEWRARGRPKNVFGRKGAKDGELNWPRGICSIPGGMVAVCDSSNHRICIFDKEGRFVRQFGGYGSGKGQLDSTAGIAHYKQRLIVSDRYNHRICVYDMDGTFISSFGGHGQGNGKFNNPWGIAIDDMGIIYVADKDNHRIQMFDKNGQYVGKFGSMGHGNGQLHNPLFLAVNKLNHQIYVSDSSNHRICIFDPHGQFISSFGSEGFQGGQFKFPRGITIDPMGNVLVADSGNNRIQVFASDGEFISTFGTWGGGAGQLKGVESLCVSDGGIVVTDRENHRIQIF